MGKEQAAKPLRYIESRSDLARVILACNNFLNALEKLKQIAKKEQRAEKILAYNEVERAFKLSFPVVFEPYDFVKKENLKKLLEFEKYAQELRELDEKLQAYVSEYWVKRPEGKALVPIDCLYKRYRYKKNEFAWSVIKRVGLHIFVTKFHDKEYCSADLDYIDKIFTSKDIKEFTEAYREYVSWMQDFLFDV